MKRRMTLSIYGLFCLLVLSGSALVAGAQPTPISAMMYLINDSATAVAWSPDGEQLAVGDTRGVRIYTRDLQFMRSLSRPTEQMKTLSWSPDGQLIAAGGGNDLGVFDPDESRETTVTIWSVTTGEELVQYSQHRLYVPSIAWSPDSRLIASGSWDRSIRIWEATTGNTLNVLPAPEYPGGGYAREILSIDWSPEEGIVAVVGSVGVFVWATPSENPSELISIASRLPPYPTEVRWSPNSENLLLGRGMYELRSGIETYFENCPFGRVWSPDGSLVAVLSQTGMTVCDAFRDEILGTFEGGMSNVETVFGYQNSIDWHPDGTRIAGAAGDGFVRIWDVSELLSN